MAHFCVADARVLTRIPWKVATTKIAHYISVSDEALSDFGNFMNVLENELLQGLVDSENQQLLYGTGTPPECQGMLTQGDIQVRDIGTDTPLDALIKATGDLRTGSSFTKADAIIVHPDDYQNLRLAKDLNENYLLGNPLTNEPPSLNGARFLVTTEISSGTALVGDFAGSTKMYVRESPRVEVHPGGGGQTEFIENRVLVRAEERLALAVVRPSALCVISDFGGAS